MLHTINSSPKSGKAKRVCILLGSRILYKKAALFLELMLRSGYEGMCLAIPRRKWDLSAYESDQSQFRTGFVSIRQHGAPRFVAPDIVFCCHWILLPVAMVFKLLFGSKVIHDDYDFHEVMIKSLRGPARWFVSDVLILLFKRLFLRHCDLIICPHLRNSIHLKNLQQYSDRVLELNNYPTTNWRRKSLPKINSENLLTLVYLGRINAMKGCKLAVDAFMEAQRSVSGFPAELHFFGTVDNGFRKGLECDHRIRVHGKVVPEKIKAFWETRPCLGLLLYEDLEYYRCIGTNSRKMFEYLASGIPIIASRLGEIESLLEKHDVGYLVDPNINEDELTHLFLHIVSNPDEYHRKALAARRMMEDNKMWWETEWEKVLATRLL